jgi:hypothetical protein
MENNQVPGKFFYIPGNTVKGDIQIEAPVRGVLFKGVEVVTNGGSFREIMV